MHKRKKGCGARQKKHKYMREVFLVIMNQPELMFHQPEQYQMQCQQQ